MIHASNGRLEDGCLSIPNGSVDVIVTSPPYFKRDGYSSSLMTSLGVFSRRVLKPGGRVFLNFGPTKEGFLRPFEAAQLVGISSRLTTWQTILWIKSIAISEITFGHFQPIASKAPILNYCHEYIFQFVKEPQRPIDRLSIGVPYMDKTNLKRDTRGQHGDRHCAGDVWFIPYETTGKTNKKLHRHSFPIELAIRCIKLANLPSDGVVCDPFSGGGTTGAAAESLGFDCYSNTYSTESDDGDEDEDLDDFILDLERS